MNSPFHSHLGTNYAPSEKELPGILAVIESEIRAARAIDKQLNGILLSAAALVKQREVNLRSANDHAALLSPIRRVPDDILSAIFEISLHHDKPHYPAPMTGAHPSVVASHVCQRWRQLAISTPSLWSGVHVLLPEYPDQWESSESYPWYRVIREVVGRWEALVDQQLEIAQVWINRSGLYPLCVTLNASIRRGFNVNVTESFHSRIAKCSSLLCSVAGRWRSAHFDLSFLQPRESIPDILGPILALRAQDVPFLESLRLISSRFPEPAGRHPGEHIITPATQILNGGALQALHLDGAPVQWDAFPVEWAALKELSFSTYPGYFGIPDVTCPPLGTQEACALLKACTGLVTCDLTVDSRHGQHIPLSNPVTLPDLQCLTVRGPLRSRHFPKALILPSLQTLRLTSRIHNTNQDVFLPWLQRFGHHLNAVSLRIERLSPDLLWGLLDAIPTVTDFSLQYLQCNQSHEDWKGAGLDSMLTIPGEGEIDQAGDVLRVVWPNLKRLRLDMTGQPRANTEEGLLAMLASRLRTHASIPAQTGIARLEDMEVWFGSLQTIDIKEELKKMNVDLRGFHLKATYAPPYPLKLKSLDHLARHAVNPSLYGPWDCDM